MNKNEMSIFSQYYSDTKFVDKYKQFPEEAVDVIIPIIHTNELWKNNLNSIYREIPVKHLLIGDGGCIDDSIEIVKKFPRVRILNHRKYKTLGYSIRKLIEEVQTEWFIYLHSDVYLPKGWFDLMKKNRSQYDWFGCKMINTVLVEYPDQNNINKKRPYAGSQMGRKAVFKEGLKVIDDDYIYRQEDFVFANIVDNAGGKNGQIDDVIHYHQTMYKPSKWRRKVKKVKLEMEIDPKEEFRTHYMQARGFIKYFDPNPYFVAWITSELASLQDLDRLDWKEFINWVKITNPAWLPFLKYWRIQLVRIWQKKDKITNFQNTLLHLFFGKA